MARIGHDTTLATTDPTAGLGDIHRDPAGKEWMYVRANSAVVAGALVSIDESYDATELTTTLAKTGMPIGVAPIAASDNEYFWAQTRGVAAKVLTLNKPAADIKLYTSATDGAVDDAVTTAQSFIRGIMLTAAPSTTAASTTTGIIIGPMQADDF